MTVKTMGIDLSLTGTAVSVTEGEEGMLQHDTERISPKTTGIRRLLDIEGFVLGKLHRHKPALVCLEGYSFNSRNTNNLVQAGELGGLVRKQLYIAQQKWVVAAPSQVKKFCAENHQAKKNNMLLACYKRWGVEFTDDNECDAFALAMLGLALLGKAGKLTKKQEEVVKKIRESYMQGV